MKEMKIVDCPVCNSTESLHHITTNALMHKKNSELYIFNKCVSCDSVFLTNPVPEAVLIDYYTDNYLPYKGASAWGIYKSIVNKSQEHLDLKKVNVVADFTKNIKQFSILDVGCGNPSFLALVQKKMNADCHGIDFSDNGWKDKDFKNISLFKTSLADFNSIEKFDVITLWHYLEHDYNLQETVTKLHQCLRPRGKLIIEVPDYDSIIAKKQKQFWQGWHSPRHMTLFSKNGFQKLFASNQWTIIKHNRFGTLDAFTLWWLGKMERKQIDWSRSIEGEFLLLVFLKVLSFPFFIFEKSFPMGIQLVVLEKNATKKTNFMRQITTVTFFKVETISNKWWAFTQMQLGQIHLKKTNGLTFYKLLGSGAKNGFSAKPNFGTYVLFCVWEDESLAEVFFEGSRFFKSYRERSSEQFTVYLNSAEAHGLWDGLQPFQKNAELSLEKPVIVLTRATIRYRKLWSFWSKVGTVSQSLENYNGLVLSIGVGEWPLIQQATISIWKTQAEMLDYAYKNPKHREVVLLTRKLNWYKEEMFARFVPFRFEGIWDGKNAATFL